MSDIEDDWENFNNDCLDNGFKNELNNEGDKNVNEDCFIKCKQEKYSH